MLITSSLPEKISKQSEKKFSLLQKKLLEPVNQVLKSRQKDLKSQLKEIKQKRSLLWTKKITLTRLCRFSSLS